METTAFYTKKAVNRNFGEANDFISYAIKAHFGEPRSLKKVQIAGTNGKGSTCAMLYSILRKCGYSVGLYTSPSLVRVNERIEKDGVQISDEALCSYIPAIQAAERKLRREFGGFDRITAAAALYYIESGVDIAVMETGLGGRFDTVTAVRDIILAVITSISLDHTTMLGSTLTEMAFEKCGILDYKTPLVTSPQSAEVVAQMNDTVAALNCDMLRVDDSKIVLESDGRTSVDTGRFGEFSFRTPLYGAHQRINAATALLSAIKLRDLGYDICDSAIVEGIECAKWRGRMHTVSYPGLNTPLLLDGAHNPGAMRALRDALCERYGDRKFSAVVSVMADKDIDGILDCMCKFVDKAYCVAVNARALVAPALAARMKDYGISAFACDSPDEAIRLAQAESAPDVLLVCGSLYLVGAVLANIDVDL